MISRRASGAQGGGFMRHRMASTSEFTKGARRFAYAPCVVLHLFKDLSVRPVERPSGRWFIPGRAAASRPLYVEWHVFPWFPSQQRGDFKQAHMSLTASAIKLLVIPNVRAAGGGICCSDATARSRSLLGLRPRSG